MSRVEPRRRGRPARSLARDESGAAIVEFALVLPILFLLVAGCFEIGRAVLVYHAMNEALRGGARYLARVPDPSCNPACSSGAVRAVAMTRDIILDNTGLAPRSVQVAPLASPPPGTVAMTAEVALGADLLAVLGLDRVLTLRSTHQEQRIAE